MGTKNDLKVTIETCSAVGEKGPGDPNVGEGPGRGNASHPQRLDITKVSP